MLGPSGVVSLGYLGAPPAPPTGHDRAQLLFLRSHQAIVRLDYRRADHCQCTVIARRTLDLSHGPITVNTAGLANAPNHYSLGCPAHPDRVAMLWQTRIWQHWLGGHTPLVARVIAARLRPAGTTTVFLDPANRMRIMHLVHLRPPGLDSVLRNLRSAGFITATPPDAPDHAAGSVIPPTR
jgi:hypothetical protein